MKFIAHSCSLGAKSAWLILGNKANCLGSCNMAGFGLKSLSTPMMTCHLSACPALLSALVDEINKNYVRTLSDKSPVEQGGPGGQRGTYSSLEFPLVPFEHSLCARLGFGNQKV